MAGVTTKHNATSDPLPLWAHQPHTPLQWQALVPLATAQRSIHIFTSGTLSTSLIAMVRAGRAPTLILFTTRITRCSFEESLISMQYWCRWTKLAWVRQRTFWWRDVQQEGYLPTSTPTLLPRHSLMRRFVVIFFNCDFFPIIDESNGHMHSNDVCYGLNDIITDTF